jgi:hypothetical protein
MAEQRYISSELIHFLGRGCASDDERYELLLEIILTGLLKGKSLGDKPDLNVQMVFGGTTLGDRTLYRTSAVCFCDIPLADLKIHITKYKGFGLGFKRGFLVTKGASPVFYVANDSIILEQRPSTRFKDWFSLPPIRISRRVYADSMVKMLHVCKDALVKIWYKSGQEHVVPEDRISEDLGL